jgi:uncharacterized protein with HEPN domain
MQPKDLGYLWDILRACTDIADFVQGFTPEQFASDKLVRFAVERQLIVVGEAAAHVSSEVQTAHKHIEWSGIIGLRSILAHDYGEILVERVWNVATDRGPSLKIAVHEIIDQEDAATG